MTMRGRVAIYMRFGTREQIDGDLSMMKQGLVCEGLRADLGGDSSTRPALTHLREDASRREFDAVLSYSYERLAREEALITDLIVELAQHAVRIESVEDTI